MDNQNNSQNSFESEQGKNTKKAYAKRLFDILFKQSQSRRMAATELGYADQTYMVTQLISDWIKQGKAAVVGHIKCNRSNRWVEAVTTNPELFPKSNQLELF
ncbi:hypothetical protein [Maribacter arcticus]|uniref:Winged helix-turn helix n=1 Tax=Maribacter arcticus TaxID=561365 RepID=A0A1T5AJD0_9FLAO|nr:hypothetical protein [Maribacter arcticus]SKB35104.1 hypothetical protein SAMN05660866_01029 [Maribacter arcticus]